MAAIDTIKKIKEIAPTISVGMATANLLSLGSDISLIEQTDVKLLHFDIMDGCFCPMMTFGPPIVKAIKTPLLKDVHLMIDNPLNKAADYVAAGADMITVPVESPHIHRVLQSMGKMTNVNDPERGLLRGTGLNPGTPVEVVEPLIDEIDMVLLLAINPGWGGQQFLESTYRRISKVQEMILASGRDILIIVDGGITKSNIAGMSDIGADILITGSAVYDGKAPVENARFMLDSLHHKL